MKETSASKLLMRHRNRSSEGIKTGAPPLSGMSMAVTYLLAMRCPVYRQRDFHLGFARSIRLVVAAARRSQFARICEPLEVRFPGATR